jgi:Secretion system C-terminal sorting domain
LDIQLVCGIIYIELKYDFFTTKDGIPLVFQFTARRTGNYGNEFSSPLGVDELNLINYIRIYPNPTKNQIHFSVQANATLTNTIGQVVATIKNVNSLDLSNQTNGIYFLTLTNDAGQVLQQSKIVKE